MHCNIRSLAANHDNFLHLISELSYKFPLIGLSETKISIDKELIPNINIPEYTFISEPSHSNAGGVAFYINDNLKYIIKSNYTKSTYDFEALWIEIDFANQSNIICGVIYRHPSGNLDNFMNYINSTIESINQENKFCLFMGDFNIDLLKIDSHSDSQNFINSLGSCFFQPQIFQPTRITDHSATLIDNIFFNSIAHFIISGNLIFDLTDHLPNFIILNNFSNLSPGMKLYKRESESELVDEISSVEWQILFQHESDPSKMFESFHRILTQIVDKHIPIKQLSRRELKSYSKPWITSAIKISIRVKNALYKKFLKTKSTHYHCKFKYYRNKLNHLMKASKRLYYNYYFLENINNSKKIWNGIKEIVRFTPKINQKIVKIMQNGNELADPKQVANAFNNYFANVGVNLARSIPKVNKLPLEYLNNPVSNTFYLFPITPSEVETQISNLKPGKSADPYSLPVNILKIIRNVISVPLASLLNTSISSGVVPEKFKVANVVPVYKKDSQTNVSNYRPISLLSVFNKILEKLISNRLLKFLEKENIFFKGQFGFRPKHSTDYAILSIIDKVQKAVDEGELSCGLFLDFSKAFDTVDHDILIDKLEYYGIRGVGKDWFTSYLKNRKQMVTVNGATSDLVTVPCGIPEGSVLGPILFLLYINDYHKSSSLLDFHLFADDANLFYRHRDIAILRQHINTELKNVNRWLCSNKLSLNIEKSSSVIFHPSQKKISGDFNW